PSSRPTAYSSLRFSSAARSGRNDMRRCSIEAVDSDSVPLFGRFLDYARNDSPYCCHLDWREPATAMERSLSANHWPHPPPAPRFLHCALRASVGMTRLLRARRYRSLMQRRHKVLVAPCLATKWPLLCGSGNAEKALEARTSDEPYKWPRNCWQMQQTWIMGANSQR